MRNTWYHFYRRLAATCLATGATAWSSAMCYAVQLAYDDATDPVYADGWQGRTTNNTTGAIETTGDNGGFGFEQWDFDDDWIFDPGTGTRTINSDSQFNDLGTAWTMGLGSNTDTLRAGRGFAPLQVGQTLSVVIDNPTDRLNFRGYFVRFNSRNGDLRGGNICYEYGSYATACSTAAGAPDPSPKLSISRFENFNPARVGQWGVDDGDNEPNDPEDFFFPLWDKDDPAAVPPKVGTNSGARIDVEITGADSYTFTMTPLDNAAAAYTESGALHEGGPIDWLEFTFFNTASEAGFETDLYIRSIEIFDSAPAGVPGDFNDNDIVDAADYVLWRNGGPLANDPTTGVQPQDYDFWRSRFGATTGSGSSLGASGAVPEPGTFVYLVGAIVGTASRRGKNRHGGKGGKRGPRVTERAE